MKTKHRKWLWLLLPLALFAGLLAVSDTLFRQAVAKSPAFPFSACQKVWGHRGLVGSGDENSLRSVGAAFAHGAVGVEIDVLYDAALDDFVVSHDRPYTLYDGKPLHLEMRGVANASIEDLCSVKGVSRELAQVIYRSFR